jgi:hypothetical protein
VRVEVDFIRQHEEGRSGEVSVFEQSVQLITSLGDAFELNQHHVKAMAGA